MAQPVGPQLGRPPVAGCRFLQFPELLEVPTEALRGRVVTASEGHQVLRNHQGLELIGMHNERFVFAARELPPARLPAPALGAADTTVVPAAPDVQETQDPRDTGEGPPPVSPHASSVAGEVDDGAR
jgi:hypothetical protein